MEDNNKYMEKRKLSVEKENRSRKGLLHTENIRCLSNFMFFST